MPEALESAIQAIAATSADEPEAAEPKQLPAWAEQGLNQLEHAAFLDFDSETHTYDFHQSVLEHARRESGLTAEQLGAGAVHCWFFMRAIYETTATATMPLIGAWTTPCP